MRDSTALVVTIQGDFGSGQFRNLQSYLLDGTGVERPIGAGVSTPVLEAQDVILVPTCGAQYIKVVRQSGTGTVGLTSYATASIDAWLAMRQLSVGPASGLAIAQGKVPGLSSVHKFGEAGNIDTADGFVDVWDGAGDVAGLTKSGTRVYTYSTTADIDSVVSSSGSDTTDLEVEGLDSNWNAVTQTVTLTGQTRVALSTNLIRVFRMKNEGADPYAGNVFCYVDGALTAGVPNTEADVRAIIKIGNEQTMMAVYTVPNGKTGYLDQFFASVSKKTAQTSDMELRFRKNGGVFRIKHRASVIASGTSHVGHRFTVPENGLPAKTDITILADSSANDGAVAAGYDLFLVDD